MVGHYGFTFWVAVCVAIMRYWKDYRFIRNNVPGNCI